MERTFLRERVTGTQTIWTHHPTTTDSQGEKKPTLRQSGEKEAWELAGHGRVQITVYYVIELYNYIIIQRRRNNVKPVAIGFCSRF